MGWASHAAVVERVGHTGWGLTRCLDCCCGGKGGQHGMRIKRCYGGEGGTHGLSLTRCLMRCCGGEGRSIRMASRVSVAERVCHIGWGITRYCGGDVGPRGLGLTRCLGCCCGQEGGPHGVGCHVPMFNKLDFYCTLYSLAKSLEVINTM